MKKPSNGWGRVRGHGAPKPYLPTTDGGQGGRAPERHPTPSHRPSGREKPYHILLSRDVATRRSPPALQVAHAASRSGRAGACSNPVAKMRA